MIGSGLELDDETIQPRHLRATTRASGRSGGSRVRAGAVEPNDRPRRQADRPGDPCRRPGYGRCVVLTPVRTDRELGPSNRTSSRSRTRWRSETAAVVARDERCHLADARGAGVREELGEGRADLAALVLVGDLEGDLRAVAVADERAIATGPGSLRGRRRGHAASRRRLRGGRALRNRAPAWPLKRAARLLAESSNRAATVSTPPFRNGRTRRPLPFGSVTKRTACGLAAALAE